MSVDTSLKYKLNKKLKLAVGKSTKSILDAETQNSRRKKGFEGREKAQVGNSDVVNGGDKFRKKKNFGIRNLKSSTKNSQLHSDRERCAVDIDEKREYKLLNSVQKRKRICADQDVGKEGAFSNIAGTRGKYFHWNQLKDGKSFRRNQLKDNIVGEKRTTTGKISSRGDNGFVEHKLLEEKSLKTSRPQSRRENAEHSLLKFKSNMGRAKLLRNCDKSKFELSKPLNQTQSKHSNAPVKISSKKSARGKKGLDDDLVVTDDKPKKKKRVIRIDPYDISNKRLDDGLILEENTKEKQEDLEKEMSKNAQFRAIQPSTSVLSFVEDNLLGRRRLIELRRSGYNIELSSPLDNIPLSTSTERVRIEEPVFRNKLEFFAAAKISSSFPPPNLPEIAFAGRSNVGKSSLLNALTRQWGVVRTSDKPGLTQTINFFKLGSKLTLVDLPGYGFAYAKEEVKDAWEELVKEYVSTRVGLKRVCLLIDTKWGMKPRDHELINLMERYQTNYQIVLTKTDVVFPIDVARRAMQIEESLKTNKSVVQPLMMVSSKSGAGIRCLRTVLAKIARFAKL